MTDTKFNPEDMPILSLNVSGTTRHESLPAGSVVLSAKEYDDLLERDRWLSALEGAGVDNWDGWDEAKDMLAEWDAEDA